MQLKINITPIEHLLWDIDKALFDPNMFREFLVDRIAEKGDANALQWFFASFGEGFFLQRVESSPNISPRTRNFWLKYMEFNTRTSARELSQY